MTSNRVAQARSLLFVPGHRHERFEKAARSGADAIVLDLEDSVPAEHKGEARVAIEREYAQLQAFDVPILVRINAADSEAGQQDIAWLERWISPLAVMLPKAESADAIADVHRRLRGASVLPIIESAAGYAALSALAAAPGVMRLVIGHLDFMADTAFQCDDDQSELAPLRFAVAIATRLAGLAPAVDGVTVEVNDEQKLRRDVRRAVRFGFGGKLCIHPAQIGIVHDALAPTPGELRWAREVVAASEAAKGAAVQVNGRMLDLPVVLRARQLLSRAAASAADPSSNNDGD